MIKKLQRKLILAAMISLIVVLALIVGIINIVSYNNIVSDADDTLKILAENGGEFPDKAFDNDFKKYGNDELRETVQNSDTDDYDDQYDEDDDDYDIDDEDLIVKMSPELPYESRYFTVSLDSKGNVSNVDTGMIAAVNSDEAKEYALEVYKSSKESGFKGDYRYIVYSADANSSLDATGNKDTSNGTSNVTKDDVSTYVIFLDCGRKLESFNGFLFNSIAVCVCGALAVLILLVALSRRIVKPFSDNYEKQKRFITDAGHELKTPLTIIDADAEVLKMDIGESEWIDDIQSQTKRLADLTNNLIFLSRMEENQAQVEMMDFCISEICESEAEAFKAIAKKEGKALLLNIDPMITMRGNEKSIRQLVTILLDNAMKYSDEAGRIELALKRKKGQIILSVFNTTEYISKESLDNLFDRFYRTDKSRNSKTGGYGLGLSIASAIVNAHEGKIFANTTDEKSLKIDVIFPA